jgi:ABC-2 type transport system ATP-binding protein
LHEPPILFLDEPTSGVDPISRRNFWDIIDTLAAAGSTVFVSTHYMEEAEYCHRLALMNRGRLIALDTPFRLREQMREPIFEVATDHSPEAVEVLRDMEGVTEVALFGRALHVTVPDDTPEWRAAIVGRLTDSGLICAGIERITPSLEDVFVARVRAEGGALDE